MFDKVFASKTLLITGGTGSFGKAVLRRLINSNLREIRIFSRDELKQDEMRHEFSSEKVKYYIGDVRDYGSVSDAMRGVDFVFHAAALKQVPSCEFYPIQAVKTNILGTEVVLESAIEAGVSKVICLSTDKAVYPINAMGISKAMMERVMIAKSRNVSHTMICGTRYGNVMASRGSVIPLFIDQIKRGVALTITNPEMTRFMMSLDEAVELVLFAFANGRSGDIFVQKAPAATIQLVADTLQSLFRPGFKDLQIIGTRHGEKLYETLLTNEEMAKAKDLGEYFQIPADTRDLNYGAFFESGEQAVSSLQEYHSHNARQLNGNELLNLLLDLREIETDLKEFGIK